jgi:hypothetical protein
MNRVGLLVLALWLTLALPAAGQSAFPFSVQASGAVLFPGSSDPQFESQTRLGWEAQARYTFSRFSLGAGFQRSTVYRLRDFDFTAALSLGFLEPRYVVVSGGGVGGYLAGRIGLGKLSCNGECIEKTYATYGGGGGVLVRVNRRLALDLGMQYFKVSDTFDSGYLMARTGFSLGL